MPAPQDASELRPRRSGRWPPRRWTNGSGPAGRPSTGSRGSPGWSRPARAVVLAEAVSWATALVDVVRLDVFGQGLRLGGPDDQWVCPAPRTVRLKGRSELRVAAGRPTTTVTGHRRGPGPRWCRWRAALRRRPGRRSWAFWPWWLCVPPPARFPPGSSGCGRTPGPTASRRSTGRARSAAVDRVVATVSTVVDARLSVLALRPEPSSHRFVRCAGGDHRPPRRQPLRRAALAALASGLPAAVSGIASTTTNWRGILYPAMWARQCSWRSLEGRGTCVGASAARRPPPARRIDRRGSRPRWRRRCPGGS